MLSESEIRAREISMLRELRNLKFDACAPRVHCGHESIASRLEALAQQYRLLAREIAADESGVVK